MAAILLAELGFKMPAVESMKAFLFLSLGTVQGAMKEG